MHTKNYQLGIASVEAVLMFPMILVLVLVTSHITKIMMTNINVINEVRLVAWRDSIGILEKPRIFKPTAKSGEKISTTISFSSPENSSSLIDDMRKAGNNHYSQSKSLTKILDGQQLGILVTTSTTSYDSGSKIINWSYNLKKKYAFVGTSIWTGEDVPVGYDKYLKDSLNSKCLFTKMFPNAGTPRVPDCYAL